jgi:hypothetical protein
MTEPSKPLGMSDFFAMEAGEYLERLDALMQKPELSTDEFVRLARALRGSALMASQPAIARVAAGVEAIARGVREGRNTWDAPTKQIAVRAVDDLKIFVRRAPSWSEADTAKADALSTELEQRAGRQVAPTATAGALGLDAGARAFVAREGAAIASALDRAAHALRANSLAQEPLQLVLRALQPLRGLAALNDLPPLPDVLEGIERAIAELARPEFTPPANVADVFQAAAGAIARGAREVAEQGRPDPDAPAFREFAELLVRFGERESEVVPVSSLYYDDAGPHIVQQGTAADRPAALGQLELVSHGEHLRQAADSLERAPSTTQRELRAHTLASTFRALANAGGGPLANRVAQFAVAAREVVTSGIAVRAPQAFAALLRRVGELLAESGSGDQTTLVDELDALTVDVRALLVTGSAPGPTSAGGPARAPGRSAAGTARAPAGEESIPESTDLVGSWVSYQRLTEAGIGPASLDTLLAASSRDTARPVPLPPVAKTAAPEPAVVDVRSLLYRGDSALARARELRATARLVSGDALRALVEEVCDLVALAIEPGPPFPAPAASARAGS